jgi:hypothetical protein
MFSMVLGDTTIFISLVGPLGSFTTGTRRGCGRFPFHFSVALVLYLHLFDFGWVQSFTTNDAR